MRSSNREGWRKGYLNIFNRLRHDSDFINTVERIRQDNSIREELLGELFRKHEIPASLYSFISHYITNNEEVPALISSSIQIVSDFDQVAYPFPDPRKGYQLYKQTKMLGNKEIKIILDYEANLDEVIETLHFYKKEIESMRKSAARQAKLTPRRRSAPKLDRNIFIKELHDKGMKPKEIEARLNKTDNNPDSLTGPDISRIIHKMK